MSMDIHEHYRRMCAGYVKSWVSRSRQPLTTVAKSIETISRKQGIPRAELAAVIEETRELSVDTFGPERLIKFDQLTEALRQRGIL